MKEQYNHCPSKANFNTKDPDTCIEEELSNKVFQNKIVKMINYLIEQTQKSISDCKEKENKQLNKLKENTNNR
jgi:hypothetical protein